MCGLSRVSRLGEYCFSAARGSVAQMACWPSFPLPRTDLSCGLSDGYAKGSEAVQDGYSYLELRHLTVEVPRHEALAQEFDAVHLRFDAASAVIAAPSSPDGSTEAA